MHNDACAATRRRSNIELGAQVFCPGPHTGKSKAIPAGQPRLSDARAVVGDLEDQVGRLAPNANTDNGRLRMAHRVTDGFLGNPEQLVPGRGRQAFFGYIASMKITPQPAGDIRALDQLLQRLD